MTPVSQRTLKADVAFEGNGIHSGQAARMVVRPAPANTGIEFSRIDLDPKLRVKATVANVRRDESRRTSLVVGTGVVRTIEHLMAAFHGLGIDNACVEIAGEELPGMDGSAKDYTEAFLKTGFVTQDAPRREIVIREPVFVDQGDQSIVALPGEGFSVSYTLSYRHVDLSDQFLTVRILPEVFEREIAPARTFCLKQEAEQLLAMGYGRGASLSNTLVFEKNAPIENRLRFPDEACRHKVIDIMGDLMLAGGFIRGHILATRSGHALNLELARKILMEQKPANAAPSTIPSVLYIEDIKKVIPHRYPFLFVDRIENFVPGTRATGFKQVSQNDYFFQGHFPNHPVMPGVIIIEAMAQVGGVIMLGEPENRGKLAYFMSIDEAKFRNPVVPGDELRMEVEVVRKRAKTGQCVGKAYVKDKMVCEATVKFAVIEP
ncbi:MAG: UDP-3-O-acyl-N-acetylglucosamine deacetylase [Candidatus Omnitrophota bacterium]